jgi:hypothetical protein
MPRRSKSSSCSMIRSDTLQAPGGAVPVADERKTAVLHSSKPTLSASACQDAARGRDKGQAGVGRICS